MGDITRLASALLVGGYKQSLYSQKIQIHLIKQVILAHPPPSNQSQYISPYYLVHQDVNYGASIMEVTDFTSGGVVVFSGGQVFCMGDQGFFTTRQGGHIFP